MNILIFSPFLAQNVAYYTTLLHRAFPLNIMFWSYFPISSIELSYSFLQIHILLIMRYIFNLSLVDEHLDYLKLFANLYKAMMNNLLHIFYTYEGISLG